MTVGSAWELKTKIGPLIRPPAGDLDNALKVLDPGESWAVLPRRLENNPNLWSPGVKYGVRPGSYSHMTEFFGPVLSVMRFEDLAEAIDLVNQTGYGLTSGLQSLDDREQQQWLADIRAGNLYINRTTVGAIVLRQPFGGMGKSAFGPGIKAGGPNYVAQFMDLADADGDEAQAENHDARRRPIRCWPIYAITCERHGERSRAPPPTCSVCWPPWQATRSTIGEEFGCQHDHFRLVGQDNFRRYLPVRRAAHPHPPGRHGLRDSRPRVCGHDGRLPHHGFHSARLSIAGPGAVAGAFRAGAGALDLIEESDEALAAVVRTAAPAACVLPPRTACPRPSSTPPPTPASTWPRSRCWPRAASSCSGTSRSRASVSTIIVTATWVPAAARSGPRCCEGLGARD